MHLKRSKEHVAQQVLAEEEVDTPPVIHFEIGVEVTVLVGLVLVTPFLETDDRTDFLADGAREYKHYHDDHDPAKYVDRPFLGILRA